LNEWFDIPILNNNQSTAVYLTRNCFFSAKHKWDSASHRRNYASATKLHLFSQWPWPWPLTLKTFSAVSAHMTTIVSHISLKSVHYVGLRTSRHAE